MFKIIEVPEEVYRVIEERACRLGKSVIDLIINSFINQLDSSTRDRVYLSLF